MTIIDFNLALITGGHGMVGSNINFGFKPTSLEMDVCSKISIDEYINDKNPSCIIHLASVNLRDSEKNIYKAMDVNINGTTNMLEVAKKLDIPFVLFSTGAVFSSKNENEKFSESSCCCPNSIYGYTKYSSEKIALLYEKTIIIRTGWLFGGNQKNHYKFVEHTIHNLFMNAEIKASNDFYGSPTYVLDILNKTEDIMEKGLFGIHHIVNGGIANGYEIALEIAKILNKDKNLVIPVCAENVPNSGPNRSNTEILETNHAYNNMRHWKESMLEYCNQYLKKKVSYSSTETNSQIKHFVLSGDENWHFRKTCRLCNSYNLKAFYNLIPTPPANHFVDKRREQNSIPLDVAVCSDCNHIQLIQIVDPSFLYSNYLYVSSTSNTMTNHLQKSVINFTKDLMVTQDDFILEIGANDGTCIKHLLENGYKNVVGVDPAENIKQRNSLPIICDFFGSQMIETLKREYRPFKLIYAFHCCAHIEDIQNVFKTVYEILEDEGTFIIEVGYFYEVFKNHCFDTIYHEHIDYHTVNAMNMFCKNNRFSLYDVKTNDIQGGSIQFFICKNTANKKITPYVDDAIIKEKNMGLCNYRILSDWKIKIINNGNDLNYILNSFKNHGKIIVGYGASAKSTTFLHQYKISKKLIDYIIDDNIYKQNLFSPGLNIPIKSFSELASNNIDYILILSWNFTDEILERINSYKKNNKLRVIVPFPEIKIF